VADHPIAVFRDFGVAHYYLFAAAIRWLGAHLFGLQLLNCALIALVAPLTYMWCRRVVPALAGWAGLLVALHPSLITLGALDLLKDPSVLFFTSLAIWSIVQVDESDRTSTIVVMAVVAAFALTYLRLDRFYIAAYLELSALLALLHVAVRGGRRASRWLPIAAVACAVLVAEVVPVRLGWPSSPTVMASALSQAATVPRIRDYRPGLMDDMGVGVNQSGGPSGRNEGGPRGSLDGARDRAHAGSAHAQLLFASMTSVGQDLALRTAESSVPESPAVRFLGTIRTLPSRLRVAVITSINTFRRLYGPFVWIMPDRWDVRTLLTNDYPMYPGMLLWYACMPMIAIGLVRTGWRLIAGRETGFGVTLVWLFTCLFLGQYLVTNLAYRHRATMIPFLFVFGLLGMPGAWSRRWKIGYSLYWAVLALIAVVHLWLRANL